MPLAASLAAQGIDVAGLVESAGLTDSDPLDALLQVAWNRPARTRSERVRQVREQHTAELAAQTAEARAVLEGLLARYEEFGVTDLETTEVFRLAPLGELGSPVDLARVFGGERRSAPNWIESRRGSTLREFLVRSPRAPSN